MDTVPQLFFASVVLSGSLFTSTYIIGNMGVLISNLDPVGMSHDAHYDTTSPDALHPHPSFWARFLILTVLAIPCTKGVRFRKKRDAADQFVLNQAVPPELASRLHLYLQL
eukprot:2888838-Prymnesium_polylepis.5